MDTQKIIAGVLIALGTLDLAFGTQPQTTIPGTDIALFPAPLSNILTQTMDVALIAGGLALWFIEFK